MAGEPGLQSDHWSDNALNQTQIDINRRLQAMTVGDYARERLEMLRRVGVSILPTSEALLPFAAACLRAELNAIDIFFRRDRTGHNLLARLAHRRDDVLRFLDDPNRPPQTIGPKATSA